MDFSITAGIQDRLKKLGQNPKYGEKLDRHINPKPSEGVSPEKAFERLAVIEGTSKGVPADTPAPKLAMRPAKEGNGLPLPKKGVDPRAASRAPSGETPRKPSAAKVDPKAVAAGGKQKKPASAPATAAVKS